MKKNNYIEMSRAFLIMMVAFFHYTYRYSELFGETTIDFFTLKDWGKIGVCCFFIISGFFLEPKSVKDFKLFEFLKKKIMRIYPSYLLSIFIIFFVLLLFPLPGREVNFIDLILNSTFLNGFIGTNYIDGAHWYITYLLIFFLIFGLYFKKVYKDDNSKLNILFIIGLIIIGDLLIVISKINNSLSLLPLVLGGNYLDVISIGVLFRWFYSQRISSKWAILSISICLFNVVITKGISTFAFVFIFVLYFYYVNMRFKRGKSIGGNIFSYLGNISFIIYLLHQNLGYVIINYLYRTFKINFIAYPLIAFSIIVLISICIYEFFEKKIQYKLSKNKR